MTTTQIQSAESLISNIVSMGTMMEMPVPTPDGWVEEAGKTIRECGVVLAEIIGGREMKNNVLLDAINEITKTINAISAE